MLLRFKNTNKKQTKKKIENKCRRLFSSAWTTPISKDNQQHTTHKSVSRASPPANRRVFPSGTMLVRYWGYTDYDSSHTFDLDSPWDDCQFCFQSALTKRYSQSTQSSPGKNKKNEKTTQDESHDTIINNIILFHHYTSACCLRLDELQPLLRCKDFLTTKSGPIQC